MNNNPSENDGDNCKLLKILIQLGSLQLNDLSKNPLDIFKWLKMNDYLFKTHRCENEFFYSNTPHFKKKIPK